MFFICSLYCLSVCFDENEFEFDYRVIFDCVIARLSIQLVNSNNVSVVLYTFNCVSYWTRYVECHLDSGGWFKIKMSSYQYRKSHCGDKTILTSSYLHNGISYTDRTTCLYWIRALVASVPFSLRSNVIRRDIAAGRGTPPISSRCGIFQLTCRNPAHANDQRHQYHRGF